MKTRKSFIVKLVAVTMMLGLFSPSINIENSEESSKVASVSDTKMDLSQGLLAKLTTSDISISLFTQAEARRGHRRGAGRAHRRAHRRANYRHHRRKNARRVIGGIAAGVAIGAVVNHARNRRSSCETVYVRGLRYEDCGGDLRRY
ncbi:hypothetical protein MNB_SV-5-974 [hydrothermal vent metagenome]|uniref:Uncharacterized protein n=1 Tax=hydrothermal vent metagenome TaxID=652676 RepID=A0A1W1EGB1_9ZZZZ